MQMWVFAIGLTQTKRRTFAVPMEGEIFGKAVLNRESRGPFSQANFPIGSVPWQQLAEYRKYLREIRTASADVVSIGRSLFGEVRI